VAGSQRSDFVDWVECATLSDEAEAVWTTGTQSMSGASVSLGVRTPELDDESGL
jgi:hypothetical protein